MLCTWAQHASSCCFSAKLVTAENKQDLNLNLSWFMSNTYQAWCLRWSKHGQPQEIWLAWAFVWQLPDSSSRNRLSSVRAPPSPKGKIIELDSRMSITRYPAMSITKYPAMSITKYQKICSCYRIENWYLFDLIKICEPVESAACPTPCIVSQCNQLFWCPSRPVWITPCTRTRWLS